ncbi:hypothetical protein COCCADRAFT_42458, partial [Bipolaris zeicola 26-R-13]
MPLKKAPANGEATDGAFKWDGPNDLKLLLLTQGRYVKPEEYEQLSTAFPGTKIGSIRNHISVLRVKQRDLYEQLGWTLPEGAAGHSAQKKTPRSVRKRSGDDAEARDAREAGLESPSKKARARKGRGDVKKEEEVEE